MKESKEENPKKGFWEWLEDWEHKNHFLFAFGSVLLVGWFGAPYWVELFYGKPQGDNAGAVGDTFNWFGSIVSALALLVVAASLVSQNRSIELQRKDLQNQKIELELQREEMERQRIEMAATARALELQVEIGALASLLQSMPSLESQFKASVQAMSGVAFSDAACTDSELSRVRGKVKMSFVHKMQQVDVERKTALGNISRFKAAKNTGKQLAEAESTVESCGARAALIGCDQDLCYAYMDWLGNLIKEREEAYTKLKSLSKLETKLS